MQVFRLTSPVADLPVPAPAAVSTPPQAGGSYAWTDEPPAPARKPSPWRWLYLPGSFVVGLAIEGAGASAGDRLESAVVLLAACFLVAAGFYVWRKATRPAIPATTFILAFLVTGMTLADMEDQREKAAGVLQETASRFAAATDPGEEIPTDVEARIAWASGWALSDLAHHYSRLASDRDVDPREYPEAWLTARYSADAGDYPQVRSYFAAVRDYAARADSSTESVYTASYRARLMEAGYTARQAEAMRHRRDGFQLSGIIADSALVLHDHLVRVDARAHYDAAKNMALFDRTADLRRTSALVDAVSSLLGEQDLQRAGSHAQWQQRRNKAAGRRD